MAEGNYDNSGFTDNADADCESFGRLYDGLWGFNGRGSVLFHSYDDCILRTSEAVCGRYYRSCKIIKTDDPHMSRKAAADAAACFSIK